MESEKEKNNDVGGADTGDVTGPDEQSGNGGQPATTDKENEVRENADEPQPATTDRERDNDNDTNVKTPVVNVSNFIDEDSVSRSSITSKSSKDVPDESDNQGDKAIMEEVSRDASSVQSTEQPMDVDKEQVPSNEEKDNEIDLVANETINENSNDDGENSENIVTEVDISSMMEVNFDEDDNSQNSQAVEARAEPEVISLDSDDDDDKSSKKKSSNDAAPVVCVDQSIFQIDADENITEVDVNSMMHVEVDMDDSSSSTSTPSRRPRRAAAVAATKTIHRISAAEGTVSSASVFRHRRKSQEDEDFDPDIQEISPTHSPGRQQADAKQNKCHVCRKSANCSIVIRQYGADLHLCSNSCFNRFRNQGKDNKSKTLPCAKCGIMENESSNDGSAFYWETMNFCSDLCVGRYQMDVGSKCCTCGINVPWTSLGKYCVRFGSDIRQFCNPQCLEGYKKNARVCFNCQLDIRRMGNVILANIASKNSPKEFCSNDCVEMYCDRNLHQPTRVKPLKEHPCFMCQVCKPVIRELVLPTGNFKACSENCWDSLLTMKGISKAEKCEMCSKFVNMDLGFTTPVYWLSSASRIYGFCSHVCKNLYVLSNRKILSCTSCKVKKYNYDLVEFYASHTFQYAVCSLACLPKSKIYLNNIREVIFLPQPTSDKTTPSLNVANGNSSVPVISAVSGAPVSSSRVPRQRRKQNMESSKSFSNEAEIIELDDDDDDDDEFRNVVVKDSDNILDLFTMAELEEILKLMRAPSVRNVGLSAKPILRTVETQTDISELNEMCRIPYLGDKDYSSSSRMSSSKKDAGNPKETTEKESEEQEPEPSTKSNEDTVVCRRSSISDKGADSGKDKTKSYRMTESASTNKGKSEEEPERRKDERKNADDEATKTDTLAPVTSITATAPKNSLDSIASVGSSSKNIDGSISENKQQSAASVVTQPKGTVNIVSCEKERMEVDAELTPPRQHQNDVPSSRRKSQDTPPSKRRSQDAPPIPQPQSHSAPVNGGTVNVTSVDGSKQSAPSADYSHPPSHSSSGLPNPQPAPVPAAYQSPSYSSSPVANQPNTPPVSPMVCPPAHPYIAPPPLVNYGAPACAPPPTQFPSAYPYNPPVVGNSSCGISSSYRYSSQPVISPTPVTPTVSGYGAASSPLGYLGAMTPPSSVAPLMPPSPTPKNPRVEYALRTWKNMFGPSSDPVYLSSMELSSKLCELINRGCKPNGERFRADMLLYISLGIQQILRDNKRADKIFYDHAYYNFVVIFTDYAERELAVGIHATIEEVHFWDASELGASSPGVMLFSLVYLFQKYFGLKTWEMQASLQFSHIVVQSRYDQFGRYIKHISLIGLPGAYPTEIPEDINCPDRCLIKLFEFYCFKNKHISIRPSHLNVYTLERRFNHGITKEKQNQQIRRSEMREGPFYKCLRQEYTPRTPWFTSQPLDQRHIYQMLVRASMIKSSSTYS